VEAARGDEPDVALLAHRPGAGRQARGRRPPDRVELLEGPPRLRHTVHGRGLEVSAGGFWQVHPAAAATFAQAVLDGVRPTAGERALDLYAGAGALTVALAAAVGETGAVVGLETVATAVADANANLAELPWAEVRQARVSAATLDGIDLRPDIVVLDPPRAGAGAEVMSAILALAPRTVGYVSCDPATLARDVAVAVGQGWQLSELRAFDAFPMTQHIECVATLQRPKDRAAP
jgi:tRNA/tmRNA/rRNA uracil-C5-methylase (TrmA/RlmC/RlmD family)